LPEGCVGELVAPELSAHLLLKVRFPFLSSFSLLSLPFLSLRSYTFPRSLRLSILLARADPFLLSQGVIDATAEIAKSNKKLAFAEQARDKLIKQRSAADYETKRPKEVQEKERLKVEEWEGEIDALKKAVEGFEKLKI
jgi:hypothetical protein